MELQLNGAYNSSNDFAISASLICISDVYWCVLTYHICTAVIFLIFIFVEHVVIFELFVTNV
jgi:hypothetical protein